VRGLRGRLGAQRYRRPAHGRALRRPGGDDAPRRAPAARVAARERRPRRGRVGRRALALGRAERPAGPGDRGARRRSVRRHGGRLPTPSPRRRRDRPGRAPRPRRRRACEAAGRELWARAVAVRPALVARPAKRRGRGLRDGRGADPSRREAREARPRDRAARTRVSREARGARRRAQVVLRKDPATRAEARHRPRRLRLLRAPLRAPRRRRRNPVADDAGATVRRRDGAARRADPPRARAGCLPRELAQPQPRRDDRPGDRRPLRPHALRRHARAGGLARRDVPRDGACQRGRDRPRAQRRQGLLPVTKLLAVRNLAAGYGGPPVVTGVTFEVGEGERIGVLGPNGGGKSTLFRALLGELRVARGSVRVPPRLGLVPQTERSRLDYPVTALDVALMGTLSRVPWWRP